MVKLVSEIQLFSVIWVVPIILIQIIAAFGIIFTRPSMKIKKEPGISFVVAVWNEGNRVAKCVNSILAQNYPEGKFNVILIGGGDENTLKICNNLARGKRVNFIHEKARRGKWFALNTAIGKVKGDYTAFVDADCVLESNWIKKMLARDADIIISEFCSISEKSLYGKIYGYGLYFTSRISEGLGSLLKSGEYMGIGSMVKTGVFKKIRFKNSFNEDWDFVNDARRNSFTVEHADAETYQHIPSSLRDYRKGVGARMKGFILSTGKDYLSVAILVISSLIAISMPFYLYYFLSMEAFAVSMLAILVISASLFSLICSVKGKKIKFVFYSPLIIPMVLVFGISIMETVFKMASGKDVKWEIYNKKSR
ncbi:MAG: glycosyltransferase family 2 protein [Candidatus Aenigmarchaeota archaeon]|nr:glycosyltransferase family 2 protein [Candidatus Aenigmarchaeota archaeon]